MPTPHHSSKKSGKPQTVNAVVELDRSRAVESKPVDERVDETANVAWNPFPMPRATVTIPSQLTPRSRPGHSGRVCAWPLFQLPGIDGSNP